MREGNEQRKKREIKIMGKRTRKQQNKAKKNAAIEGKIKTGRQKVVEENAGRCRKGSQRKGRKSTEIEKKV